LVNNQEKFIKMVWTNAKGDIDIFGKAGLSIEKYCLSAYDHIRQVMLVKTSAYSGEDSVKHEFNTRAILISTSIPSIASFGGRTPKRTPSFHMDVNKCRDWS
jgi:hypothetical protein